MRRPMRRRRRIFLFRLMCVLLIFLCMLIGLDNSLRPLVITHSTAQAQNMIDNMINNAVYNYLDTCEYTYSDLSHVMRGENNEIESVEIDSVRMNSMAANIMNIVNRCFDKQDYLVINVPIGTISGIDFFVGRGPRLRFKMDLSANISADFSTSFSEAGINQTLHSMNFIVTAQIYLMNKFYQSCVKVENTYVAAQTVIVGTTPSVMADLTTETAGIKK